MTDNIKIDSPVKFSPRCFRATVHHSDPKYAAVSIRLPKTLAQKALDALQHGETKRAALYAQSAIILQKGARP